MTAKIIIMNTYTIELIWNREFHWVAYEHNITDLNFAIRLAESIRDSGDGARVKDIRIINEDTGEAVWNGI